MSYDRREEGYFNHTRSSRGGGDRVSRPAKGHVPDKRRQKERANKTAGEEHALRGISRSRQPPVQPAARGNPVVKSPERQADAIVKGAQTDMIDGPPADRSSGFMPHDGRLASTWSCVPPQTRENRRELGRRRMRTRTTCGLQCI